ncbi:MAG: ribosome biogenesis GTP-binding protein YihA/YsxC [Gammaproteobacteria bacterium]
MDNRYQHARFLRGAIRPAQAPLDQGREVAFAGRSNAGKSSALNAITGQKALARTSKTPGRTREINFFAVDSGCRLVDLPGYGYARVSREVKQEWQRHIAAYLESRQSLVGVILLMDIRHPLKAFDRLVLTWCRAAGLATHVLLTRADKLRRGPALTVLSQVRRQLTDLHPDASVQLFSARTRSGTGEARQVLDRWFGLEAAMEPGRFPPD